MAKALTGDEVEAARRLRKAGVTWRQIGQLLAQMRGRPVAYQAASVKHAVVRFERARPRVVLTPELIEAAARGTAANIARRFAAGEFDEEEG